jgi:hypothetical protein
MTKNKRLNASKVTLRKTKVMKAGKTLDKSEKRSFDIALKNLYYFGNLFAEDKPGTLSFQPENQDHPIAVLLHHAEDVLSAFGGSERQTDSIQEDLIVNMHGTDKAYAHARKSARRVLFDLYIRQISEYLNEENGKLKKALKRALLINNPHFLYRSEDISDWVADGIVNGGSKFLRRLSDDFRNAERRSFRLSFDPVTFALALNWTNPHCPLWLMNNLAIFKAIDSLYPRITTQDAVSKRLKKKGLGPKSSSCFKRAKKHPIVDIELSANTKTIEGFVLKGGSFKVPEGKIYPFSHEPPSRLNKNADTQNEREDKSAFKELSETVKKLGKDSDESTKAIKAFIVNFDRPPDQPRGYRALLKKVRAIRPTKKAH